MVFETLLDPVFGFFLEMNPLVSILILSFLVTVLITLSYKFLTNQREMKSLKENMKKYQKQIREVQKKDPKKAMEVQKKAMELNMKYMKQSFKPTLYTFLPIIIILGWMNAHFVYDPLLPDQYFEVIAEMQPGLSGQVSLSSIPELTIQDPVRDVADIVTWRVKGAEGQYDLIVKYDEAEFAKEVLITSSMNYESADKSYDGIVKKVRVNMKKLTPLGDFSIFGWHPGWLGTYIIFSIIVSIILRKIMGIH